MMKNQLKMRHISTKMRKKLFSKRTETAETEVSEPSTEVTEGNEQLLKFPFAERRGSQIFVPAKHIRAAKMVSGHAPSNASLQFGIQEHAQDDDELTVSSTEEDEDDSQCEDDKPDIYGQIHPNETPELIATSLEEFDRTVSALPDKKRRGVDQAKEKCPALLDEKFKLMFLRCEVFNVPRAAKRFGKYWDKRIEIFGPEKAFMPLTQAGALRDDAVALSQGFMTPLAQKDATGRGIIFSDVGNQNLGAYPTESMARAVWYTFHALLEDEETQKKGLVFFADLRPTKLSLLDQELVRLLASSAHGCLPGRISAIHGYQPPKVFNVIFPVIKYFLGERFGKRIFLHAGATADVNKDLATRFTLTEEVLPKQIQVRGNVVVDHKKWLEERSANYL